MKQSKLLIILIAIIVASILYFDGRGTQSDITADLMDQDLKIKNIVVKKNSLEENIPTKQDVPPTEIPDDIKQAIAKPESNDPNDLPADLKAQLEAPPQELPEDLKRQLALPPQELPEDLKAQLNSPPPELPEDIKKALSIPPRIVTIDEVNTPPDL